MTMTRALHLIGAATHAGAYGPGQEVAPHAFRRHGLASVLEAAGCGVVELGDVVHEAFSPDPDHPGAANVDTVARVCREVARVVGESMAQGVPALVIGGDCTVGLGTVAGALEGSDSVGLVYIDGDTDLNTPATGDGILDWMGVAHLLGLPGAEPTLASLARRTPMLGPQALRFVAAENSTDAELGVVADLGLFRHPLAECLSDVAAVTDSLTAWSSAFERLLVHVDIDVLDGSLFPIADNTRTIAGLPLPVLGQLLGGLCRLPNFAALTICEVNPSHAKDEAAQFGALNEMLAGALAP